MQDNIVNTGNLASGNFAQLRQANGYYVDKTGFLLELLRDPTDPTHFCPHSDATLLNGPRGFGKSVIMSMMAEFFDLKKDSRKLFEGLKAAEHENLLRDWMNQYPVLFLEFGDIEAQSFEKAMGGIRAKVSALCAQHEEVLKNKNINVVTRRTFRALLEGKAGKIELQRSLYSLCDILFKHYGKKPIVLVDDYDVPLIRAAGNDGYDELSIFMRGMYGSALKSNWDLEFGIIAGTLPITREGREAINNVDYHDIDRGWYTKFFGFTQDDVDQLLARTGQLEKRNQLKEWYGGYRIGKLENIYCPRSVIQYLSDLQQNNQTSPCSYWINTNENIFTEKYANIAKILDEIAILFTGDPIETSLNKMFYYDYIFDNDLYFWTLLYLTGYLTIFDNKENETDQYSSYHSSYKNLNIPNRDVREAFERETMALFEKIAQDDQKSVFFEMFWNADAPGLEKALNEIMLSSACIRNYWYRVPFYHVLLQGIFQPKYQAISNREAGKDIFELTIHDKDSRSAAIIEFRHAKSAEDLDKCAHAILEQIADRKRDERLKADGCERILHWGMAIYHESRKMAARIATSS